MIISIDYGNISTLELSGVDPFGPSNVDILRFPFSIDAGLDQRFEELDRFKTEAPHTPSDAALLIGNGSLLSLAPVLPETIFVTDYSVSLLAWMKIQIDQIQKSKRRTDFAKWLDQAVPKNRASSLCAQSMEQHNFLSSNKAFKEARKKILEAKINLVHVNYQIPDSVKTLGELIIQNGNGIKVANFTNVHARAFMSLGHEPEDHEKGVRLFTTSLGHIPFTNPVAIIGSKSTSGLEPLPLASDLDAYNRTILDDIFLPVPSRV